MNINDSRGHAHIAGIIPIVGPQLQFNMPWHDSLVPIHDDYHAIERAVHSAAVAGCNTIWIMCYREMMPIIKKKVGEWVYDPTTTWVFPRPYWNKKEIPVYYVCIKPRDRKRRDSNAWSCIYGARVADWVSRKISKWLTPKKFLVICPYGVVSEKMLKEHRDTIRSDKNIAFTHNDKTFIDNEYLPFTFAIDDARTCRIAFKNVYSGRDTDKKYSDIFKPLDISTFDKVDIGWYYRLDCWDNYKKFISSEHNLECKKPKYLRTHKWHGFVDPVKGY